MKKFDKSEKILYLNDYDDKHLSKGWIHNEELETDNEKIYLIVKKHENLSNIAPEKKNIVQRRDQFILKYNKKYEEKYFTLNEFLNKKWISKHTNINLEKVVFLNRGNNNKLRIIFVCIGKVIKSTTLFIWKNIIVGTIRLILGDIIDYYPNIINLNRKKAELSEKKHGFIIYKAMLPDVGSLYKEQQQEIDKIKSEIKEIEKHNIDISRSLIAMLIAVLSLIIAIKSISN